MQAREEIDTLKANWLKDPCWDIEDTPGFEAHRDELVAFHKQMKAEWDAAYYQRIIDAITHAAALYEAIGMGEAGNDALAAFVGRLVLENRKHIIDALKAAPERGSND